VFVVNIDKESVERYSKVFNRAIIEDYIGVDAIQRMVDNL